MIDLNRSKLLDENIENYDSSKWRNRKCYGWHPPSGLELGHVALDESASDRREAGKMRWYLGKQSISRVSTWDEIDKKIAGHCENEKSFWDFLIYEYVHLCMCFLVACCLLLTRVVLHRQWHSPASYPPLAVLALHAALRLTWTIFEDLSTRSSPLRNMVID